MKSHTEKSYKEGILRALVYIQRHLDQELSLAEIAGAAHFSLYHFHRIFRNEVGETVKEHIRRLRLERSAYRLKTSRSPITEIALTAGYKTHESFTRAFANHFGRSPAAFRGDSASLSYIPVLHGLPPVPSGHLPDFTFETSPPNLQIRVEKVRPTRVAFLRNMGACGWETWQRLLAWARERRLLKRGTRLIGIRHDCTDLTPSEKVRYDACFTAPAGFVAEGEIGVQEIGGGEYVVASYRGEYGKRFAVYDYLCNDWIPAAGRVLRPDPVFEIYRRDLKKVAPQLTTIHLPLEPIRR